MVLVSMIAAATGAAHERLPILLHDRGSRLSRVSTAPRSSA